MIARAIQNKEVYRLFKKLKEWLFISKNFFSNRVAKQLEKK